MAKVCKQIELSVHIGNQPESLVHVLDLVAQHGANVLAHCLYTERTEYVLLLIPADPPKAKAAIEAAGLRCKTNQVVLVDGCPHSVAVAALGSHLGRAGVEILYSYCSVAGPTDIRAVFKTANDENAIRVLEGIELVPSRA